MIATGISDQGFMLHRRPYSDSRWLVDFLTDCHGRISGILRAQKQPHATMELFTQCLLIWRGKKDFVHFQQSEPAEQFNLVGNNLYCGMYINELICRTVRSWQVIEGLFVAYQRTIAALSLRPDVEPTLRSFERKLLKGLGYEVQFDLENATGHPIEPQQQYRYVVDEGFCPVREPATDCFVGSSLLAVAADDYSSPNARRAAKFVLRAALQQQLGPEPLVSRTLFHSPTPVPESS